jgi:ribosomal protein S15P/S13E
MAKAKAPSSEKGVNPKMVAYIRNRERKLLRHLKEFPNDKTAMTALDSGSYKSYRRKTPKSQMWSKTDIAAVQLYIAAGRTGKDYLADKMKAKKAPVNVSRKAANA